MASLKLLLGMIPSTSKIEQAEKALITEFEKLNTFSESEQLARYNELNKLVKSSDFIQKRKDIESLRYKDSDECYKEKELISLQKAKDIVLYFKTGAGNDLKRFKDLDGSKKISEFEALEKFILSSEFREKKKMKPITFRDTDEYQKFVEYKALKGDSEIRSLRKFWKKKKVTPKTKTILRYEELRATIKSSEFLAKKKMKPIPSKTAKNLQNFLNTKESKEVLK